MSDNERPAGLSGWLAVALVVAAIGGIGALHGRTAAVVAAVLAAGTSAAGVELGERTENRYVAAGSLCLTGGALLVVVAIALGVRTNTVQAVETPLLSTPLYGTVDALVVLVLALSVFAALLAQRGVLAAAPRRGVTFLVAAAVPTALLFAANSLTGDALALTGHAAVAVASFLSAAHAPGLWLLLGALALAAFGASTALEAAPLPSFLAETWHERADEARRVLGPRLRKVASFALLGALVAGFLSLMDAYEPLRAAAPGAYDAVASLGTNVTLRHALLEVGVAGTAIAGVTKLLRYFHAERLRLMRPLAAMAGGVPIAVFVAVVPVGVRLRSALERYEPVGNALELVAPPVVSSLRTGQPVGTAEMGLMVATAAVVLVLTAWGGVFVALWFGRAFEVLPRRGGGFAAAAAGVFAAGVLAALVGDPPLVLFASIALGFAVWDLGSYAVTLGSELGPAATTRQGEFAHAGGTALVTGFAAGVPAVALRASEALSPSAPMETLRLALAVSLGATLLLLVAILARR